MPYEALKNRQVGTKLDYQTEENSKESTREKGYQQKRWGLKGKDQTECPE